MIKLAIMLALVHGQVIMDNVYGSTWGPGGEDHPICKTCSTSQTCVKFTPGPKNPDKSLPYGTVIYRCDDANLIRFANKQTKPSAWGGFMDGYGNAYEPGEVDAPTCKECKKDITCVKFTAGPNNTILAAGTVRYRCDYAGLIRFANKQSDTGLTTGQLITDEVYGNTWAPGAIVALLTITQLTGFSYAQQITTTQEWLDDCLERVNQLRADHHAPPYTMDSHLVRYAMWRCPNADAGHLENNDEYGENIARGYGVRPGLIPKVDFNSCSAVMNNWYAENVNYTYTRPSPNNFRDVGHFTALVWKSTTRIGCARCTGGRTPTGAMPDRVPTKYITLQPLIA
ncbi:unnamed protein product [Medioppia subpectinata]|uniref:SCP domain-containing protein n=1 Tax=Medioppia subpectinata TaxID=1979941 RepID=A0A7R9PVD0_9ACAR|nr:unnamed protein product [Medioppia subpectinata]CAG2101708.1 unnamed protein product [Medioppia subpectinata]